MGFTEVYEYTAGKADWLAAGLPGEGKAAELTRIGTLVDADVPTCAMEDTVADARSLLGPDDVCLVVNADRVVLGLVQAEDLDADGDSGPESSGPGEDHPVGAVMQEGPTTLRPNVPAAMLAGQLEGDTFPWLVVTTQEGKLVGILRGPDLESWAEREGEEQIAALHEGHDHG